MFVGRELLMEETLFGIDKSHPHFWFLPFAFCAYDRDRSCINLFAITNDTRTTPKLCRPTVFPIQKNHYFLSNRPDWSLFLSGRGTLEHVRKSIEMVSWQQHVWKMIASNNSLKISWEFMLSFWCRIFSRFNKKATTWSQQKSSECLVFSI